MRDYREVGLETYGEKCEICNYGIVEVHHISYQEQWDFEKKLRDAVKKNKDLKNILIEAEKEGFCNWHDNQLSKDDRSTNLAVLCGNCHTLMHKLDVGKKILNVIPKRR